MKNQSGFSYVEVLVAIVLIAVSLVPALEALQSALAGTAVHAELATSGYSEVALLETVLAEPYASLVTAAVASGTLIASSYSDPDGQLNRRLVFIARYDATDADADGNPFTVPDPDSDGDGNPFTGYVGALWLRVVTQGGAGGVETLTSP